MFVTLVDPRLFHMHIYHSFLVPCLIYIICNIFLCVQFPYNNSIANRVAIPGLYDQPLYNWSSSFGYSVYWGIYNMDELFVGNMNIVYRCCLQTDVPQIYQMVVMFRSVTIQLNICTYLVPYSLNTIQKFNRKMVERGNIDTAMYMIAHFSGLVFSLQWKVVGLS
jgi:hypothetical protein